MDSSVYRLYFSAKAVLYSLSRVRGWCDGPSLVHSCMVAPSLKDSDTRAFEKCFDDLKQP